MSDIPPASPAPAPAPAAPPVSNLTPEQQAAVQAEVQRIAGGIRDEARTQGASTRQAEIDAYLAAQAEEQRVAALQGEEQLRAQMAAEATARQEAETSAAAARAELTNTQALTSGENPVNPKHLKHALALLALPADADEDARTARIEELRTEVPAFFSTEAPTGSGTVITDPPAPGVTPPAAPAGGGGTETDYERGQRLAREKYGHLRSA